MSKPWFDSRFVVWFNGVYIMTCVCGCVREGMRVHIIKSSKHGIRRLLSGLPLKHNLCECQVLIDSVNK